jgi:hypothetical protein
MFYNYIVILQPSLRKPEEYFFDNLDQAESFLWRCREQKCNAELYCVDIVQNSKKLVK